MIIDGGGFCMHIEGATCDNCAGWRVPVGDHYLQPVNPAPFYPSFWSFWYIDPAAEARVEQLVRERAPRSTKKHPLRRVLRETGG